LFRFGNHPLGPSPSSPPKFTIFSRLTFDTRSQNWSPARHKVPGSAPRACTCEQNADHRSFSFVDFTDESSACRLLSRRRPLSIGPKKAAGIALSWRCRPLDQVRGPLIPRKLRLLPR